MTTTPQDVLNYYDLKFDVVQTSLYEYLWDKIHEEDAIWVVQNFSKNYNVKDVEYAKTNDDSIPGSYMEYLKDINDTIQNHIRQWKKSNKINGIVISWIIWNKKFKGVY